MRMQSQNPTRNKKTSQVEKLSRRYFCVFLKISRRPGALHHGWSTYPALTYTPPPRDQSLLAIGFP